MIASVWKRRAEYCCPLLYKIDAMDLPVVVGMFGAVSCLMEGVVDGGSGVCVRTESKERRVK